MDDVGTPRSTPFPRFPSPWAGERASSIPARRRDPTAAEELVRVSHIELKFGKKKHSVWRNNHVFHLHLYLTQEQRVHYVNSGIYTISTHVERPGMGGL